MSQKPSTDDEWITHSLNIQGSFFQRRCVELINNLPIMYLQKYINVIDTEYPVEFPPHSAIDTKNKESRLDILARIQSKMHMNYVVDLVIECKKNNPDFINWVFFEKYPMDNPKQDFIGTFAYDKGKAGYIVQSVRLDNSVYSEGREVKGDYNRITSRDKTKTINANIEDACYQVVLATHSLIDKQFTQFLIHYETPKNTLFKLHLFLPLIVTTANLFICDYQVSDVSIEVGEIPLEKPEYRKVNSLWLEYPIPPHLQLQEDRWAINKRTDIEDIDYRRYIFIVNSSEFQNVLIYLIKNADILVDFQ
jgi:hypothetical protein